MNVAILGYGKMGHEIENMARERGHDIPLIIDVNNQHDFNAEKLKKVDVAIDFSTPSSAFQNIMTCFESGIPVVSGTTGWLDRFEEVVEECLNNDQAFFYASNFSLGVNILFRMNKILAGMMNKLPQYNVGIEEVHHTQKLDKPSGTAISLVNDIISSLDRKNDWELDEQTSSDKIKIAAVRRENVPGIHEVTYESDVDVLKIFHSAKSRKGFALGAIMAAEYIRDKKGIYTMDDLLNF